MLCQKCGKRPANAELTQVINGQKQHWHLCAQCASEMMGGGFASLDSVPSILTNMLGNFSAFPNALEHEDACPVCGMTRGRLSQTGRVGCGHCYETFASMLLPYIRSIQGADVHRGVTPSGPAAPAKAPVNQPPKDDLHSQLKKAIAEENYELAAQLRDQIREEERK